MTPFLEHLSSVRQSHMSHVYMADDTPIPVEGMGNVVVHGPRGIVTIRDCHCIPKLAQPMLSVAAVYDHGGRVEFSRDAVHIFDSNEKLALVGYRQGNSWYVDCDYVTPKVALDAKPGEVGAIQGDDPDKSRGSWQLWHARMGHIGYKDLKYLVEHGLAKGIEAQGSIPADDSCPECLEGKMRRLPFKAAKSRADKSLVRLHTDLTGPVEREAVVSHSRYIIVVVDEFTRYAWIGFLRHKSETGAFLKNLIINLERQFDAKVKCVRSDSGGEFLSAELSGWFTEVGIDHELSVPNTPQQNGVAERYNRSLLDSAFFASSVRLVGWLLAVCSFLCKLVKQQVAAFCH